MVPHHFRIRQKRNSHIISYRPPIRCQTHVPCSIYRCRNFTRANNIPRMTLILPRAGSQRYPFYCYSLNPTFWAYGPVCKCNPLPPPVLSGKGPSMCIRFILFYGSDNATSSYVQLCTRYKCIYPHFGQID